MPSLKGPEHKVIIVGAGPAGIFSALELSRLVPRAEILMFDKGPDIGRRKCPRRGKDDPCRRCEHCYIVSGWGGAGAFSDGKLNLSSRIGGILGDYLGPDLSMEKLIGDVDQTYLQHGAPRKVYRGSKKVVPPLIEHFEKFHMKLIPSRIRHLGTDRCQKILQSMRRSLEGRIKIVFNRHIDSLLVEDGKVCGAVDDRGTPYRAPFVIVAPGREGAAWLAGESKRLGLSRMHHPVDLGVRVEIPSSVLAHLTDLLYEAKILFNSPTFDDPVRTFCMCPEGEVVEENSGGVILVNGQSYRRRKTGRTNFALLVSTNFTEPFHEPIDYGKHIARLSNILGGGVLVQRLGDLKAGRRSTEGRIARGMIAPSLGSATAGDFSFVLPYRLLTGILEMLESLGKAVPGVDSPETLLYGVEAKFYSLRLELAAHLETQVKNLFVIGDGAGVSRGLVQASASGIVAARRIAGRIDGSRHE